jgi:hypothetical protein
VSGLPAALWLLGLFAAAPALRGNSRDAFPDRLRDALILGVAIPFALGLVHALYPVACWAALAICVGVAVWRNLVAKPAALRSADASVPYVLIGALVVVAWPQLMRPLLDGDSLSYHLPNAAVWVQAHSLWTTATHYWWYPPASELFASGLYAVGGPFALPWCGFGALALLGFRIAAWARATFAAPPLFADALAAAAVSAYPLAIQGGTLQNDVWLAAFWLESLWTLRSPANAQAARTLAITALLKPQGWLLAAIALIARKASRRIWLATAAAIGIWLVHDAALWPRAFAAPDGTDYAGLAGTSIVAHGPSAFGLLVRVMLAQSPFALLALIAALVAPAIVRRDPRLGWAACAAALLFFVLPFGYVASVAQLATGASLRFAAPAIAIGAVILARPARRVPVVSTILLLASTAFGIWYVLSIFWNDGGTHSALAFAFVAVIIAATAHVLRRAWPNVLAFGLGVLAATHLAARHPLDYYNDALRVGGSAPGIYRWIATEQPPAIGGWGLRLGVVNVLSPSTRTIDLSDTAPCAGARQNGVLLVAVAQADLPPNANAQRLTQARACGYIVYNDPLAVVTKP